MYKGIISFCIVVSVLTAMPAYAQTVPNKEPLLTKISDWFATAGKSQEEKYLIKAKRRRDRKIKKVQKEIARKRKKMAAQKKSYVETR